ncbi:hypothetical protein ACS0TY_032942 [Phlomoides rotata]
MRNGLVLMMKENKRLRSTNKRLSTFALLTTIPAITPLSLWIKSISAAATSPQASESVLLQEAVEIGRTFATMKDYHLDGNKEMVALGTMILTNYGAANPPHPDLEYDIQDLEDFGIDFSWWASNVRLLRPRLEGGDDDDEMVEDAVGGDEGDADMGGAVGPSGQGGDDEAAP